MGDQAEATEGSTRTNGGPRTPEGKKRSSANAVRHGALSLRPVVGAVETVEAWQSHREGVFASLCPANHLEETLTERIAIQLWRLGRVVRYETDVINANQNLIAAGRIRDIDDMRARWAETGVAESAEGDRLHALAVTQFLQDLPSMPDDLQLERLAGVTMIWAAYKAAFGGRQVEMSIPGIPDDDDEFDAFDAWTPGLLRRAFAAYAQKAHLTPEQLNARMVERAATSEADAAEEIEARKRQRDLLRRHHILPNEPTLEKIARYEASLERSLIRTLHELQRIQALRRGSAAALPLALDLEVSRSTPRQ
jgi:hypothetical protein